MRLHFRESPIHYTQYHFPYQVFAEREDADPIAAIYEQGFLPASNEIADTRELFYLARSLRLNLSKLSFDKKRRYLQRRGTGEGLRSEQISLSALAKKHPHWEDDALRWVEERYEPPYMTGDRLRYLLQRSFLKNALVSYAGDQLVGIALTPEENRIAHYWFVFYDSGWNQARSLGKWILGNCARIYQEQGFDYLYLGTCYGKAAAYKLHGVTAGVEFFTGSAWSGSLTELQELLALDERKHISELRL